MDNKEVSEPKEEKKSTKGGSWYFLLVIVIVLIVLIVGYYFYNQSQASGIQNQINQLKENNTDLNSQVTGFSVAIETLKNFSENAKGGNVPFWDENSNDIVVGTVPLNLYTARILSQNIILKDSQNLVNNFSFSKVIQNKTIWTANFVCTNVNSSSCGATVVIDETNRAYSVNLSG